MKRQNGATKACVHLVTMFSKKNPTLTGLLMENLCYDKDVEKIL